MSEITLPSIVRVDQLLKANQTIHLETTEAGAAVGVRASR
jgi:hypothetical protein